MRTGIVNEADRIVRRTKRNKIFAKQFHPLGLPIDNEVFGQQKWNPVEPLKLSHGSARPNSDQCFVILV